MYHHCRRSRTNAATLNIPSPPQTQPHTPTPHTPIYPPHPPNQSSPPPSPYPSPSPPPPPPPPPSHLPNTPHPDLPPPIKNNKLRPPKPIPTHKIPQRRHHRLDHPPRLLMIIRVLRKDTDVAVAVDVEEPVADGAVAGVLEVRGDYVGGGDEEVFDRRGRGACREGEDEVGARVGGAPEDCVGAFAGGEELGGGWRGGE